MTVNEHSVTVSNIAQGLIRRLLTRRSTHMQMIQEKICRIFRYTQRKCMCIKSDRTDGGSKTLMHVFDRFEDTDLITELLKDMYAELPEKNPKKAK